MIDIKKEEWALAREIHQQLIHAVDEDAKQAILAKYNPDSRVFLGNLGSAYLPRFHEMPTSDGNLAIGIPGLQHNFIAVGDELYVIGNVDKSTHLGTGRFGQVFFGQSEQGRTCAIKVEPKEKHSENEVLALDKMGYLQHSAEIGDKFYTIMNLFPGQSLMEMHTAGKVKDPWIAACKKLGFSVDNLIKTHKNLLGYDDFDDPFYYDVICNTMSEGNVPPFGRNDLEALKAEKKTIQETSQYSEVERLKFVIAAAERVKTAFDNGLLHRDIKGDNFVGAVNENGEVQIALVDFGGAITTDEFNTTRLFGSPTYMAPEVLCGLPEKHHQLLGRAEHSRLKSVPPGPPCYSNASDIFSFAIMCERDFGFSPEVGFGIVERAKELYAVDRPSMDEIIACFKAELLCRSERIEDKIKTIEILRGLSSSVSLPTDFSTKALAILVDRELNDIHKIFELSYKNKTQSKRGSFGFFAKPTDIQNLKMSEILEEAQKTTFLSHRKLDVLREHGWVDKDKKPAGLLKAFLDLESDLFPNAVNQQKFE